MLRRCLALLLLAGCGSNQDSLSIRGLDEALSKVYRTEGVFVKTLEAEQAGKLVRQLSLARNIDRAALATRLELAARDYGASLQGDRKWGTVLEFGLEAERLVIQFRTRAALAVVLDDYGHQGRPIRWLAEAPGPLNIAVIPFMPQSRKAGEVALERGHELLVHLPMQSKAGQDQEKGTLHLMMNDADARDLIRRSLAELPGASGTNNHQGSLATEDQRLMGLVMEELRDRDQYFLDSRTSAKSIAESSARKAGLQAARRNVFLDNHQNEAAIRRQWDKAVARALKKGESIAIGHPYPETLAVLDRALPELKNKGIDLVRVSDLVK